MEQEPNTVRWFALRFGPSSFGIYDAFPNDSGRQTHLSGQVGQALKDNTGVLFAEPTVEPVDVIAESRHLITDPRHGVGPDQVQSAGEVTSEQELLDRTPPAPTPHPATSRAGWNGRWRLHHGNNPQGHTPPMPRAGRLAGRARAHTEGDRCGVTEMIMKTSPDHAGRVR